MNCRFCGKNLTHLFVDLGTAPLSNSFLKQEQLDNGECYYPLKVQVCDNCFLVQIDEFKRPAEIFSDDYVYLSSVSKSWLDHAKRFVNTIKERLQLDAKLFVIEIASNDGYLLQYVKEAGIPCLGIEPASNIAAIAQKKGIAVIEQFFGTKLAVKLKNEGKQADLLIGNNVLGHVPDINDFVAGLQIVLKPSGTITMEFPHLMRLVAEVQFDTIYHEHFSYLSLSVVKRIFNKHGLEIVDVEELPTHGGSLRIYARQANNAALAISDNVTRLLQEEERNGLLSMAYYENFSKKPEKIKYNFLRFLIDAKQKGKTVVIYGAAAKGNTLLNYCGVKTDLIEFVCDRAESKQGKFLPGSRIPVVSEEKLKEKQPDFVVILAWNIRDEIEQQLSYIRNWNGKFVTAIPELNVE